MEPQASAARLTTQNEIDDSSLPGIPEVQIQKVQRFVKQKQAPDDLKEEINAATQAGAQIFIQEVGDGNVIAQTNQFYLTGLTFSMTEKAQLLETFGAAAVAFFGEKARVYNFQGTAVDYAGANSPHYYQSSLIKMYNERLRGSLLVERGQQAILISANHTIYGYPLNFQVQYSSEVDKMATFAMSWLVSDHSLSQAGLVTEQELELPYTYGAGLTEGVRRQVAFLDSIGTGLEQYLQFKNYKDVSVKENLGNWDWTTITSDQLDTYFANRTVAEAFIKSCQTQLRALEELLIPYADTEPVSVFLAESFSTAGTNSTSEAMTNYFRTMDNAFNALFDRRSWLIRENIFNGLLEQSRRFNTLRNKIGTTKLIQLAQAG